MLLCKDVGKDGQFWKYVVDNNADYYKAYASKATSQLWLIDACRDAAKKLKSYGPNSQTKRSAMPDQLFSDPFSSGAARGVLEVKVGKRAKPEAGVQLADYLQMRGEVQGVVEQQQPVYFLMEPENALAKVIGVSPKGRMMLPRALNKASLNTRGDIVLQRSDGGDEVFDPSVSPLQVFDRFGIQRFLVEQRHGVQIAAEEMPKELQSGLAIGLRRVDVSLWTKRVDEDWKLETKPTPDQLREMPETLRFLRISVRNRLAMLVGLPRVVARIQITDRGTGFDVNVTDADQRADLMVRLMQANKRRDAATLAVSRLKGKMDEPVGAAEGAIALLKLFNEITDPPPLRWFNNLSKRFPWLPDGKIAWVWYGLFLGKINQQQAKVGMLEAYHRGVPVTTAALMLLRDGIEMARPKHDQPLHQALLKVRTWVDAADRDAFRTILMDNGQGVFGEDIRRANTLRPVSGRAMTDLGAVASDRTVTLDLT